MDIAVFAARKPHRQIGAQAVDHIDNFRQHDFASFDVNDGMAAPFVEADDDPVVRVLDGNARAATGLRGGNDRRQNGGQVQLFAH